ncbi:MAG: protein kinase [Bacteroidota bacterium]
MDFKEYAEINFSNYAIPGKPYFLEEVIGHGKIGVVFRSERNITPNEKIKVAIKIMRGKRLRPNWENEIIKLSGIQGNIRVPRYIDHGVFYFDNELIAFIVYEFIPSSHNLNDWLKSNLVSITFIEALIIEILQVFHAMKILGIHHEDLHAGNILVAKSEQEIESEAEHFYVTDFGIGGSANDLVPKDDYFGLADIVNVLLEKIEYPNLGSRDRIKYDKFKIFLKELTERNPTVGSYVFEPKNLIARLRELLSTLEQHSENHLQELSDPFEYLSCEQIGNSFKLLAKLYSSDFLGRNDLLERNNTIFTGPRGCGKTTVFRNLSTKVALLSGSGGEDTFIGIYYQCSDLFFAFPYLYLKDKLTEERLRITAAYLNLSLLYEILETISIIQVQNSDLIKSEEIRTFIEKVGTFFPNLKFTSPVSSDPLDAMMTHVESMKRKLRGDDVVGGKQSPTNGVDEIDFLKDVSRILQNSFSYIQNKPVFFFIDDYSSPKIPNILQRSLNRILFQRNAECFFKISTESITSIYPEDASGKVLELSREYDVIDLGAYFLNADPAVKSEFITAIVNNRLNSCPSIDHKDISIILGDYKIEDTELANLLRKEKGKNGKKSYVKYWGTQVFVDICSGEIGLMLRLLKEMFVSAKKKGIGTGKIEFEKIPIDRKIQDRNIREMGNDFLVRIEASPETGKRMREIIESFAEVSKLAILNVSSKNLLTNPPKLATKIELRETPKFDPPNDNLKIYYDDLIRYSVFLRDVRGKSIRGAVVPRLYLRRLLIPTFHLTFSKRDNISLEVQDFYLLLSDPKQFLKNMKARFGKSGQEALFE